MSDNVVPFNAQAGSSSNEEPKAMSEAQVAGGGSGPHDPGTLARLNSLEASISRIEPLLIRIDERTSHLSTKAELSELKAQLTLDLSRKATRATVWGAGATGFALVVSTLAVGAAYMPYLASLLRQTGR